MSTTTDTGTRTIKVFRVFINATPERVWEAIVSPEWNQRYGYHAPSEFELKAGGSFCSRPNEGMAAMGAPDVVVEGEVLKADPPHKLVQTWRMLFSPELATEPFTTLTYDIHAETESMTRLTVTHDVTGAPMHEGAVSGDSPLQEGGGGWAWVLSDLKTLLETGESLPL